MKTDRGLFAGFLGTCALNFIHETGRRIIPEAPRMDLVAMKAIDKILRRFNIELTPPTLRTLAFAGDMVSNSLYYSVLSKMAVRHQPQDLWKKASALGLAAGVGAVVLPPLLNLGDQPRNPKTALMTIAWYTLGAFATAQALGRKSK